VKVNVDGKIILTSGAARGVGKRAAAVLSAENAKLEL
jgi:NAD(P)-dependent dehydrogenase (short-subunit alcohol dehydrogenase family)